MRYRSILLGTQENCLNSEIGNYFTVIYKKGDETDLVIIETRHSSTTHKTSSNFLPSRLTPYADEITKTTRWDFDRTCQLLTRYSTFLISVRKLGLQCSSTTAIHRLQVNPCFLSGSFRIIAPSLVQFIKAVSLIRICLHVTYRKVRAGKNMFALSTQRGRHKTAFCQQSSEYSYATCLLRRFKKTGWDCNELDIPVSGLR